MVLTDMLAWPLAETTCVLPACRTDRLSCARSMYIMQNAAVATSAATALISFHAPPGTPLFWIPVCATILIGSISSVGAMGSTISVEKEWTKSLCGTDSADLARLNSGDCFCTCTGCCQIAQQHACLPVVLTTVQAGLPE